MAWLNRNEQRTLIPSDYYEAAIIKAAARKQGSILELPDCLIAAVAIRLDLPLVTGNTEDFQAIQKTGTKLILTNWGKLQPHRDAHRSQSQIPIRSTSSRLTSSPRRS